jgi:hypothetical protein
MMIINRFCHWVTVLFVNQRYLWILIRIPETSFYMFSILFLNWNVNTWETLPSQKYNYVWPEYYNFILEQTPNLLRTNHKLIINL